jgi:hypothetical protein
MMKITDESMLRFVFALLNNKGWKGNRETEYDQRTWTLETANMTLIAAARHETYRSNYEIRSPHWTASFTTYLSEEAGVGKFKVGEFDFADRIVIVGETAAFERDMVLLRLVT